MESGLKGKPVIALEGAYAYVYYGDDVSSPQADMIAGTIPRNVSDTANSKNAKSFSRAASLCAEKFEQKLLSTPALELCDVRRVRAGKTNRILVFLPDAEIRFSIAFADTSQDFKILKAAVFVPEISVYVPPKEILMNSEITERPSTDKIDEENTAVRKISEETMRILTLKGVVDP